MLYAHFLFVVIVLLAAILLCGVVALFGMFGLKMMTGFPNDNTGYALVTALICLPLFIIVTSRCGRLLARHVPGKCPYCNTWAARMLFTHPISYHCTACGKPTKLKVFLEGGLTQDCPKCLGENCFRPTGSRQNSGPKGLLGFKCQECGHFDYCEDPPPFGG